MKTAYDLPNNVTEKGPEVRTSEITESIAPIFIAHCPFRLMSYQTLAPEGIQVG